jgi:hypothetical protein
MTGRVLLLTLPAFAIALGGGWMVIPHFGIAGACGVFVTAMASQSLLIALYGVRLMGLSLERNRVRKVLISFGVLYVAGRVLAALFPAADLVIFFLQIPAYPIALYLFRLPTDGERAWIRSLPQAVANRLRRG